MKKQTINIILMSIIGILVVAICVLIVQIMNRPRYTVATESQTNVIEEIPYSEAISSLQNTPETEPTEPIEEPSTDSSVMRGKTSGEKVNIRELPSADSRVLETLETPGTEFEILEILDSGWTKIRYLEDQEAYISSSFVILLP